MSATATGMGSVVVADQDRFKRHGSFNVSPVEWPGHDGINWWRENAPGKLLYRFVLFFVPFMILLLNSFALYLLSCSSSL